MYCLAPYTVPLGPEVPYFGSNDIITYDLTPVLDPNRASTTSKSEEKKKEKNFMTTIIFFFSKCQMLLIFTFSSRFNTLIGPARIVTMVVLEIYLKTNPERQQYYV